MSIVIRRYQQSLQSLLDLLFPPHCTVCKSSGSVLCPSCLTTMRSSAPLPYKPPPRYMNGLCATNFYQEPLRSCIHALKYDGATRLAEPLGLLLAQTYFDYGMQADIIVPIPLHSDRQRKRGYNHAQLLASVCATHIGVPLREDIVVRTRATSAQVGLAAPERRQNVEGAFLAAFATNIIYGRRIIVVDDVCTTGATLEACASTLVAAGAYSIYGLVLARSTT